MGAKKRRQDEMRRDYIQQKCWKVFEMWGCEWRCRLYKTNASVKSHFREIFPYRLPTSEEVLMQGITDGGLFGYVQCDIEVPEHLRDNFSNFLTILKNTAVGRHDIGNLMKQYAEKKNFPVQPRKMPIPSFFLTNGTNLTPLLLFYSQLGLVC